MRVKLWSFGSVCLANRWYRICGKIRKRFFFWQAIAQFSRNYSTSRPEVLVKCPKRLKKSRDYLQILEKVGREIFSGNFTFLQDLLDTKSQLWDVIFERKPHWSSGLACIFSGFQYIRNCLASCQTTTGKRNSNLWQIRGNCGKSFGSNISGNCMIVSLGVWIMFWSL